MCVLIIKVVVYQIRPYEKTNTVLQPRFRENNFLCYSILLILFMMMMIVFNFNILLILSNLKDSHLTPHEWCFITLLRLRAML